MLYECELCVSHKYIFHINQIVIVQYSSTCWLEQCACFVNGCALVLDIFGNDNDSMESSIRSYGNSLVRFAAES